MSPERRATRDCRMCRWLSRWRLTADLPGVFAVAVAVAVAVEAGALETANPTRQHPTAE